jgi:hypothetical protein
MLPVYRAVPSTPYWKKVSNQTIPIISKKILLEFHPSASDKGIEISFKHTLNVNDAETYFAFSFPWSYSEDQVEYLEITFY